jgi:RimJ/RimL family protein N-acetyltransferase
MNLIDVYSCEPEAIDILFRLLAERESSESISHRGMPNFDEHRAFVHARPYLAWYLIEVDWEIVGATYLSHQREIGIGIFRAHRGQGHARQAITTLMALHPGRFLANVNPANQKSIDLFAGFGFTHLQNTYAL